MREHLKNRTKQLAIKIIKFTDTLPSKPSFYNIRSQIIRSASSVAANYRASCRGRSTAEFLAKLGIVEEEADETLFWLEMVVGLDQQFRKTVAPLYKEMNEILSIIIASKKTVRNKIKKK